MFNKLKSALTKEKEHVTIVAPLEGEVIPVTEVNDPAFAEEILGKGVAIIPTGGRIVSPINGTVTQMFETGHAVSLTSNDGAEVLVHVGLDTVRLKGTHYTTHAKDGDKVKAGDLLIEFDREKIAADGYDTVTPVVVCNSDEFGGFEVLTGKAVKEGEEILILTKK
jgi:PTS system beta-glucosides-specific IIC component